MTGFIGNIEKLTLTNSNFRKVIYTGQHSQLVVMSLKPNEDIGFEIHEIVDQFLRIEEGQGKLILDGKEHLITEGDAFVVPAGIKHNVFNTSSTHPLKLYSIYSPPHHKKDVVHQTKEAAEADTEDHI